MQKVQVFLNLEIVLQTRRMKVFVNLKQSRSFYCAIKDQIKLNKNKKLKCKFDNKIDCKIIFLVISNRSKINKINVIKFENAKCKCFR